MPHDLLLGLRSPVPLPEFQMAPMPSFLISSGSKKKEPRCACLSEAKSSHSHKVWSKVASSVPNFLQVGLLLSPIIYKCLSVTCQLAKDDFFRKIFASYFSTNFSSQYIFFTLVNGQIDAQFFYFIIRLLQSSTCFQQRHVHHEDVKFY